MGFDWQQRVSLGIAVVAGAYFVAHTVGVLNSKKASDPAHSGSGQVLPTSGVDASAQARATVRLLEESAKKICDEIEAGERRVGEQQRDADAALARRQLVLARPIDGFDALIAKMWASFFKLPEAFSDPPTPKEIAAIDAFLRDADELSNRMAEIEWKGRPAQPDLDGIRAILRGVRNGKKIRPGLYGQSPMYDFSKYNRPQSGPVEREAISQRDAELSRLEKLEYAARARIAKERAEIAQLEDSLDVVNGDLLRVGGRKLRVSHRGTWRLIDEDGQVLRASPKREDVVQSLAGGSIETAAKEGEAAK